MRALREFFSIYSDTFVFCVELAIMEDIHRTYPPGQIYPHSDLQAYDVSDHIAYFELFPRTSNSNPSADFGIKHAIYTTVDAFKKISEIPASTGAICNSSRHHALEVSQKREMNKTKNGCDLGVVTILLHVPSWDESEEDEHVGYVKALHFEDLDEDFQLLESSDIGLLAVSSWKTTLSFYVDSGISARFTTDKDKTRSQCYGEMVKVDGQSLSRVKWTWKKIPWNRFDARVKAFSVSRRGPVLFTRDENSFTSV